MFELIFSGLLIWIGFYIGKCIEEYVSRSLRIINARDEYLESQQEYKDWQKYRLPFLKKKMKCPYITPSETHDPLVGSYSQGVVEPMPDDQTKPTDYIPGDIWALAERISRSNHKRSHNLWGEEEAQYDF